MLRASVVVSLAYAYSVPPLVDLFLVLAVCMGYGVALVLFIRHG